MQNQGNAKMQEHWGVLGLLGAACLATFAVFCFLRALSSGAEAVGLTAMGVGMLLVAVVAGHISLTVILFPDHVKNLRNSWRLKMLSRIGVLLAAGGWVLLAATN